MNGMEFKTSEEIEKDLDEVLKNVNMKPDWKMILVWVLCLISFILLLIYL